MNVLLIGGTGYLGSRLAKKLVKRNHKIVCWMRTSSSLEKLQDIIDVTELYQDGIDSLDNYLENNHIDCFLYTACVYEKGNNSESVIEANLSLPLALLEKAVKHRIPKFITIGTSLPDNVNLYALTKQNFAKYGKYFADKGMIDTFVNVSLESFYGYDEPNNRFIPSCVEKLFINENIELTEGLQHRDYIHIDDVMAGISLILEKSAKGFHDFPLGSGEAPTVREIISYLKEITNSKSDLLFGARESRGNEPNCCADMIKMKQLGFVLEYTWKDGFNEFVSQYKNERGF